MRIKEEDRDKMVLEITTNNGRNYLTFDYEYAYDGNGYKFSNTRGMKFTDVFGIKRFVIEHDGEPSAFITIGNKKNQPIYGLCDVGIKKIDDAVRARMQVNENADMGYLI